VTLHDLVVSIGVATSLTSGGVNSSRGLTLWAVVCLVGVTEPKKIRQFEEVTVVDVAAGDAHSVFAVEFDGHVSEKAAFDEKIRIPRHFREVRAALMGTGTTS
jgi:hypothetical protein